MAAVKAGFEKSLSQTSSGINLGNVSNSSEQKEVIWNIVILRTNKLIQEHARMCCVVPENIHTPTTEGIGNSKGEGGGGVKDPGNSDGEGVVLSI